MNDLKNDTELRKIEIELNLILQKKCNILKNITNISNIATVVKSYKSIESYVIAHNECKNIVNYDFEMICLITDNEIIFDTIHKSTDTSNDLISSMSIQYNFSKMWNIDHNIKYKMKLITEVISYEWFKFQEKLVVSKQKNNKKLIFQIKNEPTIVLSRCLKNKKINGILLFSSMCCNADNINIA